MSGGTGKDQRVPVKSFDPWKLWPCQQGRWQNLLTVLTQAILFTHGPSWNHGLLWYLHERQKPCKILAAWVLAEKWITEVQGPPLKTAGGYSIYLEQIYEKCVPRDSVSRERCVSQLGCSGDLLQGSNSVPSSWIISLHGPIISWSVQIPMVTFSLVTFHISTLCSYDLGL